jgi:hypothetical protein
MVRLNVVKSRLLFLLFPYKREENNSLSKIPKEFSKEKQVSLPMLLGAKDEENDSFIFNKVFNKRSKKSFNESPTF